MRIAQRGTATITGSGSAQYPVDRWAVFNGTDGNNVTFVQSTDAPAGFTNSLLATVSNAAGSYSSSGYTQITHKIEGFNCQDLAYGTVSAKPIILSFWVKSSVVGTQNVSFKNSGNNRVYIAKYTINVANTWEQKIISIVGDTTGTWLVDSGIGLEVTFNLGMGTGYDSTAGAWLAAAARYSTSDAIDFAANSGATFYLTGVQLEQNLQPTPFEQRPIGVELDLCFRYFQRMVDPAGSGVNSNGNASRVLVPLYTKMRASPTSIMSGTMNFWNGASTGTATSFAGVYNSVSQGQVDFSGGAGTTAQANSLYTTGGSQYIDFSAEL
jgi:hypothetical protein